MTGPEGLVTLNGVEVEDTFAEAFPMAVARVVITADTSRWARIAAETMTGYATSVIGCDAEAGIEASRSADETPDGRPGVDVLVFAFSREALAKALVNRIGQCVMTAPTSACYSGFDPGERPVDVGGRLRYYGDGWQISKRFENRRYWRIPVMDGEFTVEETFGTRKGVAGGNLILMGRERAEVLSAAEAAADAARGVPGVILPFPGGIARSGSKVGSKYKALRASTNTEYAPLLRGLVPSKLDHEVNYAYEIVIDGITLESVEAATEAALAAGCRPGVVRVSAGNYGGKLGPHQIRIGEIARRIASTQKSECDRLSI